MPRTVTQIQFPTPIPKARRVATYARVSSDKDTMLHSLAAQVDYYSTYIRHHPGWAYVGVYADEAKTGTRDSRENFQPMAYLEIYSSSSGVCSYTPFTSRVI